MSCLLLAEDEADIRTVMAEVLADAGYKVVESNTGDAAALLLDGPYSFDMLVTDINMPGFLDGIELAARFRKLYAICPILYVTGRPDALRQVPMRPNRERVLIKPYGLLSLISTVKTMLAAAALEPEKSGPGPAPSLRDLQEARTAA